MPRFFTTAGPCDPTKHYTLPPERRLPLLRGLVDQELYFTVHAARQSGKTTSLMALAKRLTAEGRYAALHMSCEMGQAARGNVDVAMQTVVASLREVARWQLPAPLRPPAPDSAEVAPHVSLNVLLRRWAAACPLPVVLFLDEADALLDDSLVSLLRQLREGYPSRPGGFPQSVALVGLRDVRDYKIRTAVRANGVSYGTGSPFNIKSDSLTLCDFTAAEVAELLGQHSAETGQVFEPDAVAEIVHQSQGQPWLVNALAAHLTTRPDALLPDRSQPVTRSHVLQVRELLIERRDTHLDSLVDRLREDRVRRVVEPILSGDAVFDPRFDDDFSYVRDLGLVARRDGEVVIANPIYQEIVPRILSSHVAAGIHMKPAWYLADDGTLDVGRMLAGFVEFWRDNGEVLLRGMPYQEAAPHLVFMAFVDRVANGGGRVQREFAAGTRRVDLVVELGGRRDVFELKLRRDKRTLPRGLQQVAAYARRLGRDQAWLLIFDPTSETPWEDRGRLEQHAQDGVAVTVLWA